jgi:hypothetical protein
VHPQLTDHSFLVHLDRPLAGLLEVFQLVQIRCLSQGDSLHAGVPLPLSASSFASTFHHTPCDDLFYPALYTPHCSTLPCCIPHTTRTDRHCHTHHTMPPAGIGFDAVANVPVRTHLSSTTLPSTVHMGASVLQLCTRHMLAGAGNQRTLVRYGNAWMEDLPPPQAPSPRIRIPASAWAPDAGRLQFDPAANGACTWCCR